VTLVIHQGTFKQHPLFKQLKNKRLLAYIGSRLRPQFTTYGAYVYREGEEITNFIIVTVGLAAFVQSNHKDSIFAVVDPAAPVQENEAESCSKRVYKNFGYEDSVVNHLQLLKEIENRQKENETIEFEKLTNISTLSKRYFSVRCVDNLESLTLTFQEIDMMKQDFRLPSRQFIKS
jgi:hypothetical protein